MGVGVVCVGGVGNWRQKFSIEKFFLSRDNLEEKQVGKAGFEGDYSPGEKSVAGENGNDKKRFLRAEFFCGEKK